MSTCAVRGCPSEATQVFSPTPPEGSIGFEWLVCQHHRLALDVEPYAPDPDIKSRELLMGEDIPLSIVDMHIHQQVSSPTRVTFKLGRDGIESQRVEFLMTPEEAATLCSVITHEKHTTPTF